MKKKVYTILGFDCANCAAKTEAHLNNNESITYARIDFASNRLYVTYTNEELSIDELLAIIKEVETDEIVIKEATGLEIKKTSLFDKKMWINLGRIIATIVIILVGELVFKDDPNLAIGKIILYTCGIGLISYEIFYKVFNRIFHKQNPVDEYLLILISIIGAFVLAIIDVKNGEPGDLKEGIMVVLLFQIGKIFESIATNKSKQAVMSAVNVRVEYANKLKGGELTPIRPEDLLVGDFILVKAGEIIPIDGKVIDGNAYIDKSSLTGEYIPELANEGDEVYGGCLVKEGTITIKVTKEYKDSTVAKIINLISSSGERKTKADQFITKFARLYTPIVCLVSFLYILIAGFVTKSWNESVYRGLEILVISCPCAIVISVPLAYFSALGLASKHGIVIKGTNYFDELNKMKKLITDKTGTLTHGSFEVREIVSVNCSEDELLDTLYAAECLSNHPIGKAICHGKNLKKIAAEQTDFIEFPGLGNITNYKGSTILAGSSKLLDKYKIASSFVEKAGTIIHVAKDNNYLGYVVLSDELKEDAQPMVDLLHSEGVEIVLLTGDNEENTQEICTKLGIDRWHSNLLPEDKTKILESEMSDKFAVAYIGDGINDAPSIIRSDIGIAMGGIGSDAAVENADIVIMNDDPAKVYDALKISRMARKTSLFNIIFSLLVKITVSILAVTLKEELPMVVAVISDTGLTVAMVLHSLLLLFRKVKRTKLKQALK